MSECTHNCSTCGESCGGYNLQWAWISGHQAGLNDGKEQL